MNNNAINNNNLITKAPLIETRIWEKIKDIIIEKKAKDKQSKYNGPSDVINEVLTQYSEKKIDIERGEKGKAKPTKLFLTEETNKIYGELPEGGKSYIINGLLRSWLKENE